MSAASALRRGLPGWIKPRLREAAPQYRPRPLTVPAAYAQARPPELPPRLSIVTPCLNDRRHVRTALESVFSQGYPNLEYTVIDGGSVDGSRELIEAHRERLHRFESGPDGGQADAINRGFSLSSGEIMSWLNSDDLLLPGALAFVASFFAEHPDVDMVYGHRVMIDEEDREIGLWVTPRHRRESIAWFDFLPQETAFWRRSIWDRTGGIEEGIPIAFDWDLFLRFQEAGARIVRLPRFLGAFRVHPSQKSQRFGAQAASELASIRDRHHGRKVTLDEAKAHVDALRLRSLPIYAWQRVRALSPQRRVPVATSRERQG